MKGFSLGSLKRVFLAALCVLASVSTTYAQNDVKRLAAAVDKHYNSLTTMQVEFTETYSGNGIDRSESGTLWLKKPGRMRWEYRNPRPKLFVSDGKRAWFYVPGENQVRKAEIKNLNDLRSPLRYLLGRTRLEKEFQGLSLAPDVQPVTPGAVVLRGIPTFVSDQVSQTLLEVVPDGRIVRLIIEEQDGSRTEFRFQNERVNVVLPEDKFRFVPPPGVETLQADELAAP